MIDEKYRLLEAGVSMDKIVELDEGIEKSLELTLEDLEYDPINEDQLTDALREECYNYIYEHANFDKEPTDEELKKMFLKVYEDFSKNLNKYGKTNISILIGSRKARTSTSDSDDVKQDLLYISGEMLENKYG